ncbi:MAG: hypothetical protein KDC24_03810 [Saprospiraceae bacterium]|nr:hypothetical protein [Saprospiraceae bacterium]
MKNKILIVLAVAVVGFIISCEKESVNPQTTELLATGGGGVGEDGGDGTAESRIPCLRGTQIRPAQLPANVLRLLNARFPDLTIDYVIANRERGYAVAMSNGLVLLFDTDGEFVKVCRRPRPDRDSTMTNGPRDTIMHGPRDTIRGPRDTIRGPRGPRDTTIWGPRDTTRGPRDTIRGPRGPRGPRGGGPR